MVLLFNLIPKKVETDKLLLDSWMVRDMFYTAHVRDCIYTRLCLFLSMTMYDLQSFLHVLPWVCGEANDFGTVFAGFAAFVCGWRMYVLDTVNAWMHLILQHNVGLRLFELLDYCQSQKITRLIWSSFKVLQVWSRSHPELNHPQKDMWKKQETGGNL